MAACIGGFGRVEYAADLDGAVKAPVSATSTAANVAARPLPRYFFGVGRVGVPVPPSTAAVTAALSAGSRQPATDHRTWHQSRFDRLAAANVADHATVPAAATVSAGSLTVRLSHATAPIAAAVSATSTIPGGAIDAAVAASPVRLAVSATSSIPSVPSTATSPRRSRHRRPRVSSEAWRRRRQRFPT